MKPLPKSRVHRPCCRRARPEPPRLRFQREDGSVLLFMLGFGTLALALIFVVASVAALQLQRKELLAAADAAALAAVHKIDEAAYYNGGQITLSTGGAAAAAHDYLNRNAASLGLRDVRVTAHTSTTTVYVTASALGEIPLIPWLTDSIPQLVQLNVAVAARLGR